MTTQASVGQTPASAPQASHGAPDSAPATGIAPDGGAPPARQEKPRDHRSIAARVNELKAERIARERGAAGDGQEGQEPAGTASSTAQGTEGTGDPAKGAAGSEQPTTAAEKAELASRLARAERAASDENRKRIAAEKRLQELEQSGGGTAKELADLRAKLDGYKADPTKAFLELGMDLRQIADLVNQGKMKPLTPEQKALEAQTEEQRKLQERLEAIEKREREAEEREQAAIKKQQFQVRVTALSQELKEAAEHFPGLATLPWAAQQILTTAGDDENADLAKIARDLESAVVSDAKAMLKSSGFLKLLLQDEEIKKQIVAELGPAAAPASAPSKMLNVPNQQPGQRAAQRPSSGGNGPTTLTNQASAAAGDRGHRKPTEEQRRAAMTERAKALFSAR